VWSARRRDPEEGDIVFGSAATARGAAMVLLAGLTLAACGSAVSTTTPSAGASSGPTATLVPGTNAPSSIGTVDASPSGSAPAESSVGSASATVTPTLPPTPKPAPTKLKPPEPPSNLTTTVTYPNPPCAEDETDYSRICTTIHFSWTRPEGLISGYYFVEAPSVVTDPNYQPNCAQAVKLSASATKHDVRLTFGGVGEWFWICAYNSAGISEVAVFDYEYQT
jgi:hypothetical protein